MKQVYNFVKKINHGFMRAIVFSFYYLGFAPAVFLRLVMYKKTPLTKDTLWQPAEPTTAQDEAY